MIHRKNRVNICISTNLIQLEQKAYLTITHKTEIFFHIDSLYNLPSILISFVCSTSGTNVIFTGS